MKANQKKSKAEKTKSSKRLTIGMIVKNEEKHLPHCLEALQPLRKQVDCELVIADTGSTDRTKVIALEYADLVFDFTWCDDFAAARNAVLKKAKGEWHFFIDADEYIDEDISEMVSFLNSTERKKYNAASINISAPLEIVGKKINVSQFYSYRLFRAEGNRFQSPIHEAIINNKPLKVLPTTLHHKGYIYETLEEYDQKCERNSKLLRKKLEADPDILQVVCYCLDSCNKEQDREEFIDRGLKILEKNPRDPLGGSFYGHLMSYYTGKNQVQKAIEAGESYLKGKKTILAKDIDIVWQLMGLYQVEHEQQKLMKACEWYLTLREMFAKDTLDKSELQYTLMNYYEERLAEEAKLILAKRYWKQLDEEKAKEWLRAIRISFLEKNLFQEFLSLVLQITELSKDYSLLPWCYEQMRVFAQSEEESERKQYQFFESALRSFFMAIDEQLSELAKEVAGHALSWKKEPLMQFITLVAACGQEDFAQRLQSYLAQVDCWEQAIEEVYHLAIKYQVPLPEEALAVGAERLDEVLHEIAKAHATWQEELIAFCRQEQQTQQDLGQAGEKINQLYFLIRAFVQIFLIEEQSIEEVAVETFLNQLQTFMECIYQQDWINEKTVVVLPELHQFGYWMKESRQKRSEGDKTAYLQSLRRAIQSAPLLTKIPEFYLEKFEEEEHELEQRNEEFTALAAKIKQVIDAMLAAGQHQEVVEILKQYVALCPNDAHYAEILKGLTA